MLFFLIVLSAVTSQDISSEQAKTRLSSLCSKNTLPVCELYKDYCPSSYTVCSDPISLLNTACQDVNSTECSFTCTGCQTLQLGSKNISSYVYSICNEMPMMKNCNVCPTPNSNGISNCSVLLQNYGDLCMDMPSMSQCSTWTSLCSNLLQSTVYCSKNNKLPTKSDALRITWSLIWILSLFDKRFLFLVTSLYLIQSATAQNCLDPSVSLTSCTNFKLTNASDYVNSLCAQMPFMNGCSLQAQCSKQPDSLQKYCIPFALLGSICYGDMPKMSDCSSYTHLCGINATTSRSTGDQFTTPVLQCSQEAPLPNLPSTDQVNSQIKSICNEMNMDGCDKCQDNGGTYLQGCDLLETYSYLCYTMPDMQQCSDWKQMCSSSPTLSYCTGTQIRAPTMKMYFHTDRSVYILFHNWVPTTDLQYAFTLIFCFLLAGLFEFILMLQQKLETKWIESSPQSAAYPFSISNKDNVKIGESSSDSTINATKASTIMIIRFFHKLVIAILGYALMLLAMTYDAGVFLSIVFGFAFFWVFLGAYLTRFSRSNPNAAATFCC